jgi:hypothetical protein
MIPSPFVVGPEIAMELKEHQHLIDSSAALVRENAKQAAA